MNGWVFCIAFIFVSIYFLLIGRKLDEMNDFIRGVRLDRHIKDLYEAGLLGEREYRKLLWNRTEAWGDYFDIKVDKKEKNEKKEGE